MTVSIIIAVKGYCENLKECVDKCLELEFSDFEILILPDAPFDDKRAGFYLKPVPISIIPTGPISPPQKRDMAMGYANGAILAFIDDDAYPAKDWLKNAVEHFKEEDVAAVGGPSITPPDDSLRQGASGIIYSSFFVSGKYAYRYLPKKKRQVDDYPTCNLLVRKTIMQELGGFNTNYWPGEDTKLCLEITKRLDKKIIYDPEVIVYHHRRPLFLPHLKQIANYALHRGYFVKKYPQTSLRTTYFLPSIFLISLLIGGILSVSLVALRLIYFLALSLYIMLVFIFSISKELHPTIFVFFGIILSHFTYGFYFIKGLLSKSLPEDKVKKVLF